MQIPRRILLITLLPATSQAAFIWTGSLDADFSDESNWLDSTTSSPPASGTFQSQVIIGEDVEISSATVAVPQSYGAYLGNGQNWIVNDAVVTGQFNTSYHPVSLGGGGSATISLNGSTTYSYGWSWDIKWSLKDSAQLTALNSNENPNGGVLGRSARVNFDSLDTRFTLSSIDYTSESSDRTSFISKLSVLGEPAVVGENLLVTSNGSEGTVFTPIPEPSSSILILLGGSLLLGHRGKRAWPGFRPQ